MQTSKHILDKIVDNLEILAERVHDGWLQYKESQGWHYAEIRDDDRNLHNTMVPYARLLEVNKQKDRRLVQHFAEYAKAMDFIIQEKPPT